MHDSSSARTDCRLISEESESELIFPTRGEDSGKDHQDVSDEKGFSRKLGTKTTLESKNKIGWKTWTYMIGAWTIGKFLSDRPATRTDQVAFFLAALHLLLFKVLDRKDVTAPPANIRQSDVTAVSLLIATGFRTAIISSIGISVTQYLWRLFRLKVFEIRFIEDLFQIRSNILSLINPKIVRHTPFMFLTVLGSWLVPLATIYPPTALTIQMEARWTLGTVNASVFNPTPKEGEGYFESLEGFPDLMTYPSGYGYYNLDYGFVSALIRCRL